MATGKVVARPLRPPHRPVHRHGEAAAQRGCARTNRARYRAEIAKEKSLRLKLVRRMLVSGTAVKGGKVTIAGRVVRPLGAPVQRVIVKRRLSCGRYQVIKRFTPPASGRFQLTVGGPGAQQAAVYRLQTRVRKFASNPKLYPTFTLPRYVDLAQ